MKKLYLYLLMPVMLLLGACGEPDTPDTTAPNAEQTTAVSGQIIIDQQLSVLAQATENNKIVETDMIQVDLYFADREQNKLVRTSRMIPKAEGLARATVQELIMGPDEAELTAALPSGTVLKDINIRDGVCIVDFNSALKDGISSQEEESLCVYSIVNTLTQFDSVDEVKILVEGQNISRLRGALDISATIAPNMSIVSE